MTLARASLEIRMKTCNVFGSLVLGSGSPSFTFNYPPNIIIHSGGVLQDLTSSKLVAEPGFFRMLDLSFRAWVPVETYGG